MAQGNRINGKSCPTLAGVYTNVGGSQSTSSLNVVATSSLFYRCQVTCGSTATSTSVSLTVNPILPGGTYTINNTLPTTPFVNYNSFTAAVNAMACGISGPVIFNVTAGQTFTEDVPAIVVNSTVTNTLKFRKSGAGANPVILPTGSAGTTDAGIAISGTDYLTFDGIDINIATGRVQLNMGILSPIMVEQMEQLTTQ
ncbi:MAG: hypothetical protein IPP29_22930 [Bacteroidetes bacterium]|nr:hypothetical protein [Bacteroidota bacterium]